MYITTREVIVEVVDKYTISHSNTIQSMCCVSLIKLLPITIRMNAYATEEHMQ